MKDNLINFEANLLNTEISENVNKCKILSEFLNNSIIYFYQTKHGTKDFKQKELDIMRNKYDQLKIIVDEVLNDFEQELNPKC